MQNQASSDANYFITDTVPIHLPGLVSTDAKDSPHLPQPQKALPPEVPGWTDIVPERTGVDFGQQSSFKYTNNDNELIKEVTLCVRFAQIAAAGGGANARYPDDVINASIDKIEFQIGGTTQHTLYGDEIHFRQIAEDTPEELLRLHGMQRANLTPVQRAALAANPNGFWAMLEIPFWWTENTSKHWHQYAVQRQTKILITWRAPEYILQQDLVNARPLPVAPYTTYIVDHFLRFGISVTDTATKNVYIDGVKKLGAAGLNTLVRYLQKQENNVVLAGATRTSIKLDNFNRPTFMIRFVIRPEANLIPSYLNNQRFATMACTTYRSDASGHRLFMEVDDFFAKYGINAKEFLGSPMHDIYHMVFTDYADVTQYPMGCIEFAKLQNPTCDITWTGGIGANAYVDFWAYCYDYLRLVIQADGRAAVALEQPV